MLSRCRVILVLLAIFVLVASSVTIGVYHYLTRKPTFPKPPAYFREEDVSHTKEYQITLKHDLWENRTQQIQFWIDRINELFPVMNATMEKGTERLYSQYHMDANGMRRCFSSGALHIRQRENIKGGKYEGKTTLDIKQSGYDWEVCPLPFWPAEHLYNVTSQKCENDVHPCFSKHSRVSKVVLEGLGHSWKTCEDLHRVFPGLFAKNKNKLNRRRTRWVHMWEYSGYIYDTKFVWGFDNAYPNEKRAASGTGMPPGGEWSLRVYPVVDGPNPQWNETLAKEIDDFYFKMVLAFTKFDHHVGCVHDYFRNGWRN